MNWKIWYLYGAYIYSQSHGWSSSTASMATLMSPYWAWAPVGGTGVQAPPTAPVPVTGGTGASSSAAPTWRSSWWRHRGRAAMHPGKDHREEGKSRESTSNLAFAPAPPPPPPKKKGVLEAVCFGLSLHPYFYMSKCTTNIV